LEYDIVAGTLTNTSHLQQSITCLSTCGTKVGIGTSHAPYPIKLWETTNHTLIHTLQDHTAPVWDLQLDDHKLVSGGGDMCIKVWNTSNGQRLYSLLGGSLQERGNNPAHPVRSGCSGLKYDSSRIIGSFNSLLRVYSFGAEDD